MEIIHHMSREDLCTLVSVFAVPEYIDEFVPEEDFFGPGIVEINEEFYRIPMWLDFLLYPEDHK